MEGRGELTQDQQAGKGGSCYVLCCRVTGQTHPQDQGSCYRLEQWRSHPSSHTSSGMSHLARFEQTLMVGTHRCGELPIPQQDASADADHHTK